MATRESGLSAKCVKNKPSQCFAERIENSCGNGTADLVLSWNNIDTWIELKCCTRPKKLDTPIDCSHIRKGQVQWHRRKRKVGCDTWILIQVGSNTNAYYFVFDSILIENLRNGRDWKWYCENAEFRGTDLGYLLQRTVMNNYMKARA